MSRLLFDGVFNFIETYLRGIGSSLKNLDILFYCFIGIELLFVLYFIIKSHFAYEFRLIRAIDKLNIYLLNNSYINENNLIEFNKKMKKVPKTLRYHWQQYMLYRENPPSFYMSSNNCIEKPLKSSSLTYNIKTIKMLTTIFVALSILLSSAVLGLAASQSSFISPVIFRISIIPAICVLIGGLYVIFQSARQTANLADLYQTFHIYQRLIDKASTTIPDYVDFEVLFTKKEIAKGIPALNEYLEKRARQEQEELEKARKNAVEHEVYDFGEVDISGSLILDRAMKETEIFLSLRNRLLAEIQQTESEIDTLKKAYDNTQREFQRKMQASKENVERFRLQQESSTNRIESNYIRKQQDDEIKKQQTLEKENADTTLRFNQDVAALSEEIEKRKKELEERRKYIESAMVSEYKTYSTKIFKNLTKLATEKEHEERQGLATTKNAYAQQIVELKEKIEELNFENGELKKKIKNFDSELNAKESFYTNALIETAEKAKSAISNKKTSNFVEEVEEREETPVEQIQETEPVAVSEEVVEEVSAPIITETEKVVERSDEQPPYDEFGGYYDSEGYYRYANGTYYDPQGNFHDETGGYYDTNGNYFPAQENQPEQTADIEEKPAEKVEEFHEVTPVEEIAVENVPDEITVVEEAPVTETPVEEEIVFNAIQDLPSAEIEEISEQKIEEKDEEDLIEFAKEEQQPKRGRGRPKKVEEAPIEEPVEIKKGRGRPKKVEEPVEVKKGRGRPKKEADAQEVKRAGRPPKAKGPGRPKKEEVKKPGRPPKAKGPGRPAKSSGVGRPKKAETKKPGRPPKAKGPGRPKKDEVKRPGRPKKESVKKPGRPAKAKGPGRPPKAKGPGRPKKS